MDPPYPTMEKPGYDTTTHECGNADAGPQPGRRIEQPIEHEHAQKRHQQTDCGDRDRLGQLDYPHAAAKVTKLLRERPGNPQFILPMSLAHGRVPPKARLPISLLHFIISTPRLCGLPKMRHTASQQRLLSAGDTKSEIAGWWALVPVNFANVSQFRRAR